MGPLPIACPGNTDGMGPLPMIATGGGVYDGVRNGTAPGTPIGNGAGGATNEPGLGPGMPIGPDIIGLGPPGNICGGMPCACPGLRRPTK